MLYLKQEDFYQRYKVSPEGLVLWLDQSDGRSYGDVGNWYDLSGNGNHGTQGTGANQPAITGAVGLAGACRDFDGNDFIDHGDVLDIGLSDWTVSIWMKTSIEQGGARLVSKNQTGTVSGWFLSCASSGKITGGLGGIFFGDFTGTYDDDEWHNIIAVWNRSTVLEVFFDTVSGGTFDISSKVAVDEQDSISLNIGARDDVSLFYTGLIDVVQIFSRALSDAEINLLFLADKPRHGGL